MGRRFYYRPLRDVWIRLLNHPADACKEIGLDCRSNESHPGATRQTALQRQLQIGRGKIAHFKDSLEDFRPARCAEAGAEQQAVGG